MFLRRGVLFMAGHLAAARAKAKHKRDGAWSRGVQRIICPERDQSEMEAGMGKHGRFKVAGGEEPAEEKAEKIAVPGQRAEKAAARRYRRRWPSAPAGGGGGGAGREDERRQHDAGPDGGRRRRGRAAGEDLPGDEHDEASSAPSASGFPRPRRHRQRRRWWRWRFQLSTSEGGAERRRLPDAARGMVGRATMTMPAPMPMPSEASQHGGTSETCRPLAREATRDTRCARGAAPAPTSAKAASSSSGLSTISGAGTPATGGRTR